MAAADFLDLTELPVEDPDVLYFQDGHLSGRGHQFAAEALQEWITRSLPASAEGGLPGSSGRPSR